MGDSARGEEWLCRKMATKVSQGHFAHKRAYVSSRREQREKDRGSVLHKLRQSQYVGRTPMSKQSEDTNDTGLKKGAWSPEEDQKLMAYIRRYGIWNWTHMPKAAGLARSGKSCRLRWLNYLRPNIKHGNFSSEEEEAIIKWHQLLGNKWSTIAGKLPGRTDNEIKNFWNSRLKKNMGSEKSARAPTNHPRSQVAVVPPPNTKPSNDSHPNILESSSQEARLGTSPSTSKVLESGETSKNSLPPVGIDNKVVGDSDDVSSSILPEAVEGMELDLWEKIFLSPLEDDFETTFMVSSWLELPVNYCQANSSTDGHLVYDNLWEN